MRKLLLLPPATLIRLMLCCGMLQIAAYLFVGFLASSGTQVAVPQPDTLLYCQAARQIVAGQPFVFTPGDKPSTGTTSHLYPFVLALPYALGATEDRLLTAGFALNALFYLVFLASWGIIACKLCTVPLARGVACVLLAVSGHAAYCALAQSDMGIFMALSASLLAALLSERRTLFAALLLLAPWCRLEGAVFAVLFAGFLALRRFRWRDKVPAAEWRIAAGALLSAAAVPLFNLWLTGVPQFHSVLHKGYFQTHGILAATFLSIADALRMGRELLLGLPERSPRELFFLPLLGAAFAWIGLALRPWKNRAAWKEAWWLLACIVGFGGVATSGWQNTNMDRYLAWALPIWLLYTAEGSVWLCRAIPRGPTRWRWLPIWVPIAFQLVSAIWMVAGYDASCTLTQQSYDALRDANGLIPADASIGSTGSVGGAYALSRRRVVSLAGVYSPDMLTGTPIVNLERLKHTAALRFDYWLLSAGDTAVWGQGSNILYEAGVPLDFRGLRLAKAKWGALDRALLPMGEEAVRDVGTWRLVDSVDVGYPEDEKRCDYQTFSRFHRSVFAPFGFRGTLGTNSVVEVGRAVIGSESMTLRVKPHTPVRVVLRTAEAVTTRVKTVTTDEERTFVFNSPLKLRIHVDGKEAGYAEPALTGSGHTVSEVVFTLPGQVITHPNPRITVYGDHASFAYWFYQPEQSTR